MIHFKLWSLVAKSLSIPEYCRMTVYGTKILARIPLVSEVTSKGYCSLHKLSLLHQTPLELAAILETELLPYDISVQCLPVHVHHDSFCASRVMARLKTPVLWISRLKLSLGRFPSHLTGVFLDFRQKRVLYLLYHFPRLQ